MKYGGRVILSTQLVSRFCAVPASMNALINRRPHPVPPAVWELYARVIAVTGPVPTLIEWDNEVPDYPTLRAQARNADRIMDLARGTVPGAAA